MIDLHVSVYFNLFTFILIQILLNVISLWWHCFIFNLNSKTQLTSNSCFILRKNAKDPFQYQGCIYTVTTLIVFFPQPEWRVIFSDVWCSCGPTPKRLWRWRGGQQTAGKNVSTLMLLDIYSCTLVYLNFLNSYFVLYEWKVHGQLLLL